MVLLFTMFYTQLNYALSTVLQQKLISSNLALLRDLETGIAFLANYFFIFRI